MPLLLKKVASENMKDICIVFPDAGATKRFKSHFEKDFPIATCLKVREGKNRIIKIKEGEVAGKQCIIVDDLVMTGKTLIECAKVLKENGAQNCKAFATHAVFPKDSWNKFTGNDLFDAFYITDTIPNAIEIAKHHPFKLLSISEILVDILLSYDVTLQ